MKKKAMGAAVFLLLLALSAVITAHASGGIENDVSEENENRFDTTSPWLSGMESSIYENSVDAGEEEQDISVSSPGWVEKNIAELFRNMASSLISVLQDNMGASIDSIIYGRVGSGRPDSVNIYAFELRKGNPYGVTAAVCYSLLRGMMFVFLGVHFVFQLAKSAWSGQTAKSREEIKAQIPMLLAKFTAMLLMPYLLDVAIYVRDVLLFGIKEVTGQMVTGGATLSLSKAFLINAERSGTFVDAVMYLGTVVLTIYFVFLYVAVAIDMLVCFVSFPFICVLHGRKRDLIGGWITTVFSNLMTPVVDAVLLLVPLLTSMMLSDVIRGVAVIQLVMCMLIIPARIRFKALLGIQSNDRNGFLGAMAVMTFARALASGVKRGAGRIAEAVSDAKRSRVHGELADADREEEAALLSADTGGQGDGRAVSQGEGGVEGARMQEDMYGDAGQQPDVMEKETGEGSDLYGVAEGGDAFGTEPDYSDGLYSDGEHFEGTEDDAAFGMEPDYSDGLQPEGGYPEEAENGTSMNMEPDYADGRQPEEGYHEGSESGSDRGIGDGYTGEPHLETAHWEGAGEDGLYKENARTSQEAHGAVRKAEKAKSEMSENTKDARINALREADRKVEESQTALDRLRMERAETVVKDKKLRRNMLDYGKGSEEYKNLEKERADVESRTAMIDKKIALESGRLNRLRRQSGELHSAFGMKSTPTGFEQQRAEILRKRANISNFEQPEFKGILSNDQMRILYRNRAIAGGIKALAGTAGAVAGGTLGGSSAVFLGGSAVAMAAAGGIRAGGDAAEVTVDAMQGAGHIIRRGAGVAGKGAYRAAEMAASEYLMRRIVPAAVQVQMDGVSDESGAEVTASKIMSNHQEVSPSVTEQPIQVEVQDSYPTVQKDTAEAKEMTMEENARAQISYDVSRVIEKAVSLDGEVMSGSMLHVLQKANVRLEREVAVMREEGASHVAEEVIRERRAAIRTEMLSEAIVSSMEKMGYQKGTEEYADVEELVREKVKKIFEESEKPLI